MPTARELLQRIAPAHERLNHDIVYRVPPEGDKIRAVECSCGEVITFIATSLPAAEEAAAALRNVPLKIAA